MSYIPQRLRDERDVWVRETRLSLVSLGILHYSPQGGGYHEGNDLLAQAGRQNTDYSKRESERDRPGTDAGSAIDIGYFDVNVQKVDGSWRRVTLRDYTRWMLVQLNAGAPDVAFVRELIYSLDGVTVKRWDRLGIRTSGDLSHTTHDHRSDFRDDENANKAAHVERFWREMRGISMAGNDFDQADTNAWRLALRVLTTISMQDNVVAGEPNLLVQKIKAMDGKLDLLLAEAASDRTRDAALAVAVQALAEQIATGGGSVDVAAIVNAVNAAAGDVKSVVLDELEEQRRVAAEAAQAAADALDNDPSTP